MARQRREPDPDDHAGDDCGAAAHEPQTIRHAVVAVNLPSRGATYGIRMFPSPTASKSDRT
jgi:hypothetical protein